MRVRVRVRVRAAGRLVRGEGGGLLELGQVQPEQQLRAHEGLLEVEHLARLRERVHLVRVRVTG